MRVDNALLELAVAEHELAQAALRFAAAHQDATTDEGVERMLATREALLEAVGRVDDAERVWFTAAEEETEDEYGD